MVSHCFIIIVTRSVSHQRSAISHNAALTLVRTCQLCELAQHLGYQGTLKYPAHYGDGAQHSNDAWNNSTKHLESTVAEEPQKRGGSDNEATPSATTTTHVFVLLTEARTLAPCKPIRQSSIVRRYIPNHHSRKSLSRCLASHTCRYYPLSHPHFHWVLTNIETK